MRTLDKNGKGSGIEMMQFVLINGVGMFGGWSAFAMCAVYSYQGMSLKNGTLLTIFVLSILSGIVWGFYMWFVKRSIKNRFSRSSK